MGGFEEGYRSDVTYPDDAAQRLRNAEPGRLVLSLGHDGCLPLTEVYDTLSEQLAPDLEITGLAVVGSQVSESGQLWSVALHIGPRS